MFHSPIPIVADVISPWVMVGALQLLVGNALIGVIEGFLLAKIFKVPCKRAISNMILANYVSMIVGWVVMSGVSSALKDGDSTSLYTLGATVRTLLVMSFVLTLVLEWPFCYETLKGIDKRFRRSILGNLIVQSASYALLIPFFFSAGQNLLRSFTPDPSLASKGPNDATVFFIDGRENALYRVGVDGSGLLKLRDVPPKSVAELQLNEGTGFWDMTVKPEEYTHDGISEVIPNFARNLFEGQERRLNHISPWSYGGAYDYRPLQERQWQVHPRWNRISAVNTHDGQTLSMGMDLPCLTWMPSSATVLPGDRVVYSMGGQILLADLTSRQICMLARGKRPIVMPNRCLTAISATQPASGPASGPAESRVEASSASTRPGGS